MIRKYYNHTLQTNPWHREEEPHNNHEVPGRQTNVQYIFHFIDILVIPEIFYTPCFQRHIFKANETRRYVRDS